ncbi:MAG: hypothetical protein RLZZ234_427 [Candidatus Parcubacteria bacterium]|jgi:uncharacterized protein YegP (UPF0339 family)
MSTTSFELYKDKAGHFRWKLVSRNGESVAEGGEGYVERRAAMNAIKKLKVWASTEKITDMTVTAPAPAKKAAPKKK